MIKLLSYETVNAVCDNEKVNIDRYDFEIQRPISKSDVTIVVDFESRKISGQCVDYGDYYDLEKEKVLYYAKLIKNPTRNFDDILKEYEESRQIFNIEIEETLLKTVEVEASNVSEALEKVEAMYLDEEIVLSSDDFYDKKFNVVQEL